MNNDGDRDLERRLDKWLSETAKPAPAELAEDVLLVLSRQERGGWFVGLADRFGSGRSGRGLRLVATAAAVVIVVGAAATLGRAQLQSAIGPSPTAIANVWDPAADFRAGADASNPSPDRYGHPDVWSYRYALGADVDPSRAPLLTAFDFGESSWLAPAAGSIRLGVTAGSIRFQPAAAAPDGPKVLLVWASPISGGVRVHGTFAIPATCLAGEGRIRASVDRGAVSHWVADVIAGSSDAFDFETEVDPGVSLSFVVVGLANPSCEATTLSLAISSLPGA